MITKEEWDLIARCVANHPAGIKAEDANNILKKLSELSDCERDQACIVNTEFVEKNGGEITHGATLDHTGRTSKKIMIEYDINDKT